jgi:acetolactate synthase-1/2/3 large subunit
MSIQELAMLATENVPVVVLVQNNSGYMSIRGGQRKLFDRHVASEFTRKDGTPYSPDFVTVARGFGITADRVDDPAELESTLQRAVDSDGPVLVEVPTARDAAGPWVPGWWDFPIPGYIKDERQEAYWAERAEEQHL